jgi:hypothetical protein
MADVLSSPGMTFGKRHLMDYEDDDNLNSHNNHDNDDDSNEFARFKRCRINEAPTMSNQFQIPEQQQMQMDCFNPTKRRNVSLRSSIFGNEPRASVAADSPFTIPSQNTSSLFRAEFGNPNVLPVAATVPDINWEEKFSQFRNECEAIICQKVEENKLLKRAVAVSEVLCRILWTGGDHEL